MALLQIRTDDDPVLRLVSKPVKKISPAIRQLLDDMAETMYKANGVGLAAPQVGVSKRIIVVDVGDGLIELINPEIEKREGEVYDWEGCLSFPGIAGKVRRSEKVVVKSLDRHGNTRWYPADGLLSRCFQHEIDHLDGIVLPDRADRIVDRSELVEADEAGEAPAEVAGSEVVPDEVAHNR